MAYYRLVSEDKKVADTIKARSELGARQVFHRKHKVKGEVLK